MSQGFLHAAAVSLFQYNTATQAYDPKGQVGAAVTGDAASGVYKLVCYKDQTSYMCTATITSNNDTGLKYQVEQTNYASFRDDNGQQWSIYFAEENHAQLFTFNVVLAIYGASGTPSHTICTVDLLEGTGQRVDVGDSVGVKFNGYYVGSDQGAPSLSYQYDSNMQSKHTYRFKIPSSNTNLSSDMKGFEGAVCGMSMNSKRCLVVPAACRGGIEAGGNGTLIVVVDVRKVKKEEPPQQQQQQQPQQIQMQMQPQPTAQPQMQMQVSGNFQDWQAQQAQQQQQQVGMLTMAGQQVLPVAQAVQPVQAAHPAPIQPVQAPVQAVQPVQPAQAAPASPPAPAGLTSEQLKTVNEMSSNVVSLVTHVNEVGQKVDLLTADFKMAQKQQKPTTLTAAQLQHSVTAMLEENKQSKDEIRAKDDMIKTLENRCLDLEKKVDKFAQSAHSLMEEKKNAATTATDTKLEMDRRVLKLQEDMQRANSERDDAQRHLATVKKLLDLSEEEIRKLKGETEITKVHAENTKMKFSHTEDSLRTEREARKLSDEKVLSLSAELSEARDTVARKEAMLQDKLRKIDADRIHFNNLLEEERNHAEKEMKALRDEMLTELQNREKRFAAEKERVSEDSYNRGTEQGKEDGLAEARIKYEDEMARLRASAMQTESELKEKVQHAEVEKEQLEIELTGHLSKIQGLMNQVTEHEDSQTLLRAELEVEKEKNSTSGAAHGAEMAALNDKITGISARLEQEMTAAESATDRADTAEQTLQEAEIRLKTCVESLVREVVPRTSLRTMVTEVFAGQVPDLSFEEDASLYPAVETEGFSHEPPASLHRDVVAGTPPQQEQEDAEEEEEEHEAVGDQEGSAEQDGEQAATSAPKQDAEAEAEGEEDSPEQEGEKEEEEEEAEEKKEEEEEEEAAEEKKEEVKEEEEEDEEKKEEAKEEEEEEEDEEKKEVEKEEEEEEKDEEKKEVEKEEEEAKEEEEEEKKEEAKEEEEKEEEEEPRATKEAEGEEEGGEAADEEKETKAQVSTQPPEEEEDDWSEVASKEKSEKQKDSESDDLVKVEHPPAAPITTEPPQSAPKEDVEEAEEAQEQTGGVDEDDGKEEEEDEDEDEGPVVKPAAEEEEKGEEVLPTPGETLPTLPPVPEASEDLPVPPPPPPPATAQAPPKKATFFDSDSETEESDVRQPQPKAAVPPPPKRGLFDDSSDDSD